MTISPTVENRAGMKRLSMSNIVTWAVSKMHSRIGGGECARLAEAGLIQAGMKTTTDFGVVGNNADCVWGDPISLEVAKSGDIIPFRNHVMSVETKPDAGGGPETYYSRHTILRS